jgi:transcriptional regulator with XRE-family HTH domain
MSNELRSPGHQVLRQMLSDRRKKAGLSQTELARRMGVSQSTVSAIERGDKRVTVLQYLDWAQACGFNGPSALRRVDAAKRR